MTRPALRRLWYALALGGALLLAAVAVAAIGTAPGVPLDPESVHPDGSRALARILAGYGAPVRRSGTVAGASADAAGSAVVVTAPDGYTTAQLRRLRAAAGHLVLVAPGRRALTAVLPGAGIDTSGGGEPAPGCADPGAIAAGDIDIELSGSMSYDYPGRCYGGLLVIAPHVTVLGSAQLLRNDTLSADGVAAIDVNAITDNGALRHVTWLLPGNDASAGRTASVWELFPPAAPRAFWWLAAVGVLLAVWRARRLGGVVAEPLPVVVRSAESVEGHGRLYRRAGARDRAAAALRTGAVAHLAAHLGLPHGSDVQRVAAAAAPLVGVAPAQLVGVLGGPAPDDDAGLVRLARELDALRTEVDGRMREDHRVNRQQLHR